MTTMEVQEPPAGSAWLRVAVGVAAFAAVAYVGIGVLGDFSAEAAANSWALWSAVGLAAGFVAYAAVEYAQTGTLASIRRQFDTRTIVLVPFAIAINIVLGAAVATALKIPIYLDSIGTILVGALAGPIAGALTGFLANVLWTYVIPPPFQSSYAAAFAIVAAVIGLIAGLAGRWGLLRPRPGGTGATVAFWGLVTTALIVGLAYLAYLGYQAIIGPAGIEVTGDPIFMALGWLALGLVVLTVVGLIVLLVVRRDVTAAFVVLTGAFTGVIAALISAPISANLFSGVTGAGTDFLVAAFRQAGAEIGAATLGQGLISDPVDKVITYVVVYLVLTAMSIRMIARFPQGERLVEGSHPEGMS